MKRELKIYASIVVCAMPLVYCCYVLLFWLLASAALGQWALPGIHDPKVFLFGFPSTLGLILMLSSLSVAPLVLYLGHRRGKFAIHALAYGTRLILAIVLFGLDIQKITTWIAD